VRVILDAGALIASERAPRAAIGLIDVCAARSDQLPIVPSTVVAQVWRGGRDRQAPLAALLADADIDSLDADRARKVGQLLADSAVSDITDAHVVVTAHDGDVIITSDPVDIARLARAAGKNIRIVTW
jgi:hypothetical protein